MSYSRRQWLQTAFIALTYLPVADVVFRTAFAADGRNIEIGANGKGFTAAIADIASKTTLEGLSPDEIAIVKNTLLDFLAVAVAGSGDPAVNIACALAESEGAKPQSFVIGRHFRTSSRSASFINGVAGHALDYDDSNPPMRGHTSGVLWPAILALAEESACSGRTLVEAFAAGFDAASRLGIVLGDDLQARGFHPTAVLGSMAAAVACARLRRLDRDGIANAISLAALTSSGLQCAFGGIGKPLQVGRAAENGVTALLATESGARQSNASIEDRGGFAAAYTGKLDLQAVATALRAGPFLPGNLFKFDASCHFSHGAVEAIRAAMKADGVTADNVAAMTINLDARLRSTIGNDTPTTGTQLKFSERTIAAMVLLRIETADPNVFSAETARRPDVALMREKIGVEFHKDWGIHRTRVDMRLRDGRTSTRFVDKEKVTVDTKAQNDAILAKANTLLLPIIGEGKMRALVQLIGELESVATVRNMGELLCAA
jgi:2-methylcitrate dehydratase PrpD